MLSQGRDPPTSGRDGANLTSRSRTRNLWGKCSLILWTGSTESTTHIGIHIRMHVGIVNRTKPFTSEVISRIAICVDLLFSVLRCSFRSFLALLSPALLLSALYCSFQSFVSSLQFFFTLFSPSWALYCSSGTPFSPSLAPNSPSLLYSVLLCTFQSLARSLSSLIARFSPSLLFSVLR